MVTSKVEGWNGVQLACDRYGGGNRCVILGHGGGQTRHAWGNAARALEAHGWNVLTFDSRGHGDSDWSADGDYGLTAFVGDLHAIVRSMPAPPVLVGASLSGLVGLVAAGEQSDAPLRALVLVDITPTLAPTGVDRIVGFMQAHLEEGFDSVEKAADVIAAYLPKRPRPSDLSGLAKNLRLGPDGRYRWHWDPRFVQGTRSPRTEKYRDRILAAARAIAVPTLLVRGQQSELVTEEGVREFLDLVPHAQFQDISEAGHMIAGDRNDAFVECVLGFLGQLPHAP